MKNTSADRPQEGPSNLTVPTFFVLLNSDGTIYYVEENPVAVGPEMAGVKGALYGFKLKVQEKHPDKTLWGACMVDGLPHFLNENGIESKNPPLTILEVKHWLTDYRALVNSRAGVANVMAPSGGEKASG